MDAETLAKATELIRALNDMRTVVILVVAGVVLLGFACYMYYLRQRAKERASEARAEAQRQQAKADRAATYAGALQKVATAVQHSNTALNAAMQDFKQTLADNHASVQSTGHMTIQTLVRLDGAIAHLARSNNDLASKLIAKLTTKDALNYVYRVFMTEIYYTSLAVVRKTLIENGYEDGKERVSNRVRADLGSILRAFRADLDSQSALSVRIPDFFEMEASDPTVERFVLCNSIWAVVERYLKEGSKDAEAEHMEKINARIEDAEVTIQTVIRDYFTRIAHLKYKGFFEPRESPTTRP